MSRANQWMDPRDFGATVHALGEALRNDGSPEARASFDQPVPGFL